MTDKEVDITELTEYSDHEEETKEEATTTNGQKAKKGDDTSSHSLHTSSFRDFHLRPELLRAISDCGFEHPSEVQHECIPQAILGTDVLCQAKSGMGKTAVFVLSILQQLQATSSTIGPLCLVLCHTRELAYQICKEFDRFKKYLPDVKTGVFYGGVPVQNDRDRLKEEKNIPHVVIGTPGRVLQLCEEKVLPLKNLKYFVLDECDKILETLDMRKDIQSIFKMTPHDKQVMMFTATLSDNVRPICKKFMHNPLEIYINDGSKLTLHGLKQYYVRLEEKEKTRKLVDLLDALEFNQVVIFVRSNARANALHKLLLDCNFPAISIHGDLKQEDRIERYRKFKDFQSRIMVATNLFGRGIDIERVNVVINYDMSESSDTYLHRVGRAGRFGTKGLAISFVTTEDDNKVLEDVQKRFVVSVPELPNEIDASSYMNA